MPSSSFLRRLAGALLVCVLVPTASAQRDYSISLNAGYAAYGVEGFACDPATPSSGSSLSTCTQTRSTLVDPTRRYRGEGGGAYGVVRIGAGFSERAGAEISVYSHRSTQGTLPIEGSVTPRSNSTWAAGIDFAGTFQIVEAPVRPTVVAGFGILQFGKNGSLLDTGFNPRPTLVAGAGLEYDLPARLLARVDGRLRIAFDGAETLARGAELSAGVGYKF